MMGEQEHKWQAGPLTQKTNHKRVAGARGEAACIAEAYVRGWEGWSRESEGRSGGNNLQAQSDGREHRDFQPASQTPAALTGGTGAAQEAAGCRCGAGGGGRRAWHHLACPARRRERRDFEQLPQLQAGQLQTGGWAAVDMRVGRSAAGVCKHARTHLARTLPPCTPLPPGQRLS